MTAQERNRCRERDRIIEEVLQSRAPVARLEELMGPDTGRDERHEVDEFLRARARWQQPYSNADQDFQDQ